MCILRELPRAVMIFADPPDNIGLKYDNGQGDDLPDPRYRVLLSSWAEAFACKAHITWLSVNARYQNTIWRLFRPAYCRMFPWYFTFGQHRETDCGNNYRPIFRIAPPGFDWHADRIRIQSKRQKMGDKRANPGGRVPGDVWGGPEDVEGFCRIQGNNKERRAWHPTQHPEKLVERCILMSTNEGDLVIDPFGGTGTTLRVCNKLNRRCIMIELSGVYCWKIAEENNVPVVVFGDGA